MSWFTRKNNTPQEGTNNKTRKINLGIQDTGRGIASALYNPSRGVRSSFRTASNIENYREQAVDTGYKYVSNTGTSMYRNTADAKNYLVSESKKLVGLKEKSKDGCNMTYILNKMNNYNNSVTGLKQFFLELEEIIKGNGFIDQFDKLKDSMRIKMQESGNSKHAELTEKLSEIAKDTTLSIEQKNEQLQDTIKELQNINPDLKTDKELQRIFDFDINVKDNSLKNTSFIQRQIDKIKKSTPITNTYRNFKSYFNDITNYINKTSIRVNLEKVIGKVMLSEDENINLIQKKINLYQKIRGQIEKEKLYIDIYAKIKSSFNGKKDDEKIKEILKMDFKDILLFKNDDDTHINNTIDLYKAISERIFKEGRINIDLEFIRGKGESAGTFKYNISRPNRPDNNSIEIVLESLDFKGTEYKIGATRAPIEEAKAQGVVQDSTESTTMRYLKVTLAGTAIIIGIVPTLIAIPFNSEAAMPLIGAIGYVSNLGKPSNKVTPNDGYSSDSNEQESNSGVENSASSTVSLGRRDVPSENSADLTNDNTMMEGDGRSLSRQSSFSSQISDKAEGVANPAEEVPNTVEQRQGKGFFDYFKGNKKVAPEDSFNTIQSNKVSQSTIDDNSQTSEPNKPSLLGRLAIPFTRNPITRKNRENKVFPENDELEKLKEEVQGLDKETINSKISELRKQKDIVKGQLARNGLTTNYEDIMLENKLNILENQLNLINFKDFKEEIERLNIDEIIKKLDFDEIDTLDVQTLKDILETLNVDDIKKRLDELKLLAANVPKKKELFENNVKTLKDKISNLIKVIDDSSKSINEYKFMLHKDIIEFNKEVTLTEKKMEQEKDKELIEKYEKSIKEYKEAIESIRKQIPEFNNKQNEILNKRNKLYEIINYKGGKKLQRRRTRKIRRR